MKTNFNKNHCQFSIWIWTLKLLAQINYSAEFINRSVNISASGGEWTLNTPWLRWVTNRPWDIFLCTIGIHAPFGIHLIYLRIFFPACSIPQTHISRPRFKAHSHYRTQACMFGLPESLRHVLATFNYV